MNTSKMIHGIDSLYFFCESNPDYDNLYLEILDQMETIKGTFEKKEIEFENQDIHIRLNDITLNFLGKANGFYWFKDINNFFKIGFKDTFKQTNVNDIMVQLQTMGIYTVGIKSLVDFINESLLKEYTTGYNPITRVDLNTFVQHDFSFVSKEMFSTRKRKYSTISEIGTAKSTQTIYVGGKDFKLRLYNKKEELKKSSKKDFMYEYFLNHGFTMEDSIFNIEFEMHRQHLRLYNILSVTDLLEQAVSLFRACMEEIRLIDMDSVSQKKLEHNKYEAKTLEIWDEIKNNYELNSFTQTSLPLQRIKRKLSIYDDTKFRLEYLALLRKALINNVNIDSEYLNILFIEAKESLTKSSKTVAHKDRYIPVEIIQENGDRKKLRLLDEGSLLTPLDTCNVSKLQDYELHVYLEKTKKKQNLTKRDNDTYQVALKEAMNRNLIFDYEVEV